MSVYVDGLVVGVVRAALPVGTRVGTLLPADWLTMLPLVVVKDVSPSGSVDPRFSSTRAVVQFDAYAAAKRAAWALCDEATRAVIRAWRAGTFTAEGVISFVTVQGDPSEIRFPDQPSSFTRYTATHTLTCRK